VARAAVLAPVADVDLSVHMASDVAEPLSVGLGVGVAVVASGGVVLRRRGEQRDQSLDLGYRVFISFLGAAGLVEHGIDQNGYRLGDAVKTRS
jgi:hypothetical protein